MKVVCFALKKGEMIACSMVPWRERTFKNLRAYAKPPQRRCAALPYIWSPRLSPELRQRVNSGAGVLADSRMKNLPGYKEHAGLVPPDSEE